MTEKNGSTPESVTKKEQASSKKASKKPKYATLRPFVANHGRIMDFTPNTHKRPLNASKSEKAETVEIVEEDIVEEPKEVEATETEEIELTPVRPTPRRRQFLDFKRPAKKKTRLVERQTEETTISEVEEPRKPRVAKKPVVEEDDTESEKPEELKRLEVLEEKLTRETEEVDEEPRKPRVAKKPVVEEDDTESEKPEEQEEELEKEPVQPRRRGVRMDFMKRVTSVISPVIASKKKKNDDEPDIKIEIDGADVVDDEPERAIEEEDDSEEPAEPVENPPAERVETEEEIEEEPEEPEPIQVTRVDTRSVIETTEEVEPTEDGLGLEEFGTTEENDGYSDAELEKILAGFADEEPEENLSDNSSKEVVDFEEELDALEAMEEVSDDFLSEPKPLFGADEEKSTNPNLDPLVEQSMHRKKPKFKPADTYIDGMAIAKEEVEKPKPVVEPYRQILGGRSPFLNSVSVEKRPLSNYAPEKTELAQEEKKPIESSIKKSDRISRFSRESHPKSEPIAFSRRAAQDEEIKEEKHKEEKHKEKKKDKKANRSNSHIMTSIPRTESFFSNVPLIFAIILTLILGSVVGTFIYLVFFQ